MSICGEILTDTEELVSAWQLLGSVKTDNRLDARDSWLLAAESFGCDLQAISDATDDWLLVDWLMRNTDRHYNNFGQDAHRAQATRAGQELGQIRPGSTRRLARRNGPQTLLLWHVRPYEDRSDSRRLAD